MKDHSPFGNHHQSIPFNETGSMHMSMYNSRQTDKIMNNRNAAVSQTSHDFYKIQPDKARHQHSQSLLNDYSANNVMHKTMYGNNALASQP